MGRGAQVLTSALCGVRIPSEVEHNRKVDGNNIQASVQIGDLPEMFGTRSILGFGIFQILEYHRFYQLSIPDPKI